MASALDSYVNSVRTLSQQGNFTQLVDLLTKSADTLVKNPNQLDNALDAFNIQEHSLGVLGILIAKYAGNIPTADFDGLFNRTADFIKTCNGEHVRYYTEGYAELCHRLTQNLIDKKQPIRGIIVLARAVTKIQLSATHLTSIHSDLCKLCLLSKCLAPAVPFLEHDTTEISKEGNQFDAKYFLLYYYYGGMIYTALKNYTRALFFFEIAVTTPSMAVSHIMLEAYKKYVLVSLMLHGKTTTLPRYTSHVVSRYIKPLCQPYQDLASAYNSSNPSDLNAVVNRHTDTFNRDHNMGLVKQCTIAYYKKNIKRLTKTFMTLSLSDMASRVQLAGPKEAEKYVLHMIEDGEIFATISQKDGMVSFHDNPEKYNSVAMLQRMDDEMAKCMVLEEKMRQMDQEITVNPLYVQKACGLHDEDGPMSSVKLPGGHML